MRKAKKQEPVKVEKIVQSKEQPQPKGLLARLNAFRLAQEAKEQPQSGGGAHQLDQTQKDFEIEERQRRELYLRGRFARFMAFRLAQEFKEPFKCLNCGEPLTATNVSLLADGITIAHVVDRGVLHAAGGGAGAKVQRHRRKAGV